MSNYAEDYHLRTISKSSPAAVGYHTALMGNIQRSKSQTFTIRLKPEDAITPERCSRFMAASVISALITVVVVAFFATRKAPDIILSRLINNLDTWQSDTIKDKSTLLSSLFSEQARGINSHINIITEVVNAHSNHPNPKNLAVSIVSESFKADYDPLFVAAVIKTESTFKQKAISNRGAQGLMQIMPSTAEYISKIENISKYDSKGLYDTNYNIRVGIAYLKYLDKKFGGNKEKVLIAYNWGPGNLDAALKNGSSIPDSTRIYARKVLTNYKKWRANLNNNKASFVA